MRRLLWIMSALPLLPACKGCGTREEPTKPPAAAEASTAPVGPSLAQDAAALAAALKDDATRPQALQDARTVMQAAITAGDGAVAAEVGRSVASVDPRLARALLERARGLLKETSGDAHFLALAELYLGEQRPLEAAGLLEQALRREPTPAAEYVALSDAYLAADRLGPARAAVERGRRALGASPDFDVQDAEVQLVSGNLDVALGKVDAVLAADAERISAALLRGEILAALGRLDDAASAAGQLAQRFPDEAGAAALSAAIAGAQGDAAAQKAGVERARTLAGDCVCTEAERAMAAWAEGVPKGAVLAPRRRAVVASPSAAPASTPALSPEEQAKAAAAEQAAMAEKAAAIAAEKAVVNKKAAAKQQATGATP